MSTPVADKLFSAIMTIGPTKVSIGGFAKLSKASETLHDILKSFENDGSLSLLLDNPKRKPIQQRVHPAEKDEVSIAPKDNGKLKADSFKPIIMGKLESFEKGAVVITNRPGQVLIDKNGSKQVQTTVRTVQKGLAEGLIKEARHVIWVTTGVLEHAKSIVKSLSKSNGLKTVVVPNDIDTEVEKYYTEQGLIVVKGLEGAAKTVEMAISSLE